MTAPTFYADLAAMRARGDRPLGGVVVTDTWRTVQNAAGLSLQAIYFRKSDRWTEYELGAL
ncbi:MAG: hypothetical protein ABI423_02015, partial [Burkholderiales bacterium]